MYCPEKAEKIGAEYLVINEMKPLACCAGWCHPHPKAGRSAFGSSSVSEEYNIPLGMYLLGVISHTAFVIGSFSVGYNVRCVME